MKFPVFIAFFLFTTFYILHSTYYIPIVSAQNCTTDTRVTSGLITTPSVTGKFGVDSTGKCIASNETSFAPFKIPTFDDLKSLYFDQSKLDSNHKITLDPTDLPAFSPTLDTGCGNCGSKIYYRAADFKVSDFSNIIQRANGNNVSPAFFFIRGNLFIDQNPAAWLNHAGVVFVVSGAVVIDQIVTQVDAVIISSGVIYTAGANCQNSNVPASTLTINGSLVSLDSTKPPVFCRTLGAGNNTEAAERVVQQPKYLVILRDLFSDTLQKWSEIQ